MESEKAESFQFDSRSPSLFEFDQFAQRISSDTSADELEKSFAALALNPVEDVAHLPLEDERTFALMKLAVDRKNNMETEEQREERLWKEAIEMNISDAEIDGSMGYPDIPDVGKRAPYFLQDKRARFWMGTHNRWSPKCLIHMKSRFRALKVQSFIIFKEVAPETGHVHAHSLVCFGNPVRFETVSKLDVAAHWDTNDNGALGIYKYISKDGKKVYQYGDLPKSVVNYINRGTVIPKKSQFQEAIDMVKAGEIDQLKDTRVYAQYQRYFDQRIASTQTNKRWQGELPQKNHWVWGPAGSGKSRAIWDSAEQQQMSIYSKLQNKWWDGYHGEQIVLIEDVHPDWTKKASSNLKIWADRYPFHAEIKGSVVTIPTPSYHLVITSNYSIDECFEEKDLDAIKRRFTEHYMGLPDQA